MTTTGDGVPPLGLARRACIYVLEARAQFLTLARTPEFTIPTLVFPLMFYVIFGVVMSFSLMAPTFLLATYGVFGLIGPSLFGFGVGFATERDSGALLLKRTTPMPVAAYLLARVATAVLFGMVIVLGLFLLGAYAAEVTLYRWQWFALAGVVLSSVVPFCALGLAIGAWVKAQSAVAIVNLVYLPMGFLSGLWMPIALLPSFLQDLAVVFPAYHQSQLALKVVDLDQGGSTAVHALTMASSRWSFSSLRPSGSGGSVSASVPRQKLLCSRECPVTSRPVPSIPRNTADPPSWRSEIAANGPLTRHTSVPSLKCVAECLDRSGLQNAHGSSATCSANCVTFLQDGTLGVRPRAPRQGGE